MTDGLLVLASQPNCLISQEITIRHFIVQLLPVNKTGSGGRSICELDHGISVVAEVKTGQRRLIEFFLSPLLRYKEESLGER